MSKIITTALVAAAMFAASNAFAGEKACCAKGASNKGSMSCVNLAALNLTADQKAKIEAWQSECMKAGCSTESRKTFLSRAKAILSAEQFAQLRAQCKKTANAKKTEA
jgi:Spy/CpxP family protein refolding chaperone